MLRLVLLCCLLGGAVRAQTKPAEAPAKPADTVTRPPGGSQPPAESAETPDFEPRTIATWLEVQVELSRRGFSCGSIDGVRGLQTAAALKAWQKNEGLKETGDLDRATKELLKLTSPVLTEYTFTALDLAGVRPVPTTWLGKSELDALRHGTALELVAERHRTNPKLLLKLNPKVDWENMLPGQVLTVPDPEAALPDAKVARIHIYLAEKILQAVDETGRVLFHCPVSIARNVEKRPVGELYVVVVIPDPNYTFDPEVFPEVPEAAELGRKLIIAPGPNNPVGVAWIGLDRTGYGIHGTPDPEKVGRTESHGCFRVANWDARALLQLVWVGMPVMVDE
ncbi:MAG TPA: L,D-transpeptidase [Lacunisphaera sp.]|nr:L,D-transpeptidase [Lacunisphaera sp.]